MDHVWDAFYAVGLTSSPGSVPIFSQDCQRNLDDYYEVVEEGIGQGSFATIRKVKLRKPHENQQTTNATISKRHYYACKTIPKSRYYDRELFLREVYNLSRCQTTQDDASNCNKNSNNHCVLRLLDVLEDRYSVHIITELCEGGELFDHVVKEHERTGMGLRGKALSPDFTYGETKNGSELRCASIVHQLLQAFAFLHSSKVCHRDAKASNFVFVQPPSYVEGSLKLKLIDFGLSKFVGSNIEERDYRKSFYPNDENTSDTTGPDEGKTIVENGNQVSSIWNAVKTVYDFYPFGDSPSTGDDETNKTVETTEISTRENHCDDTEFSYYSNHCRYMTSAVGTPYYVAPEVLIQGKQQQNGDEQTTNRTGYTTKCDIWSVGVLAFLTLTGSLPIMGEDEQETVQKLMDPNLEIDFSDETLWEQDEDENTDSKNDGKPRISNAARKFCRALLQKDPEKRPTAKEALQFEWIAKHCESSESVFDLAPPASITPQPQPSRSLPSLSTSL